MSDTPTAREMLCQKCVRPGEWRIESLRVARLAPGLWRIFEGREPLASRRTLSDCRDWIIDDGGRWKPDTDPLTPRSTS